MSLREQIKAEGQSNYARLRGGYSVPLAGAIYWLAIGLIGYQVSPYNWSLIAFVSSGMIFPVAIGLSKLLKNDFMGAKSALDSVMLPAFVAMLLFWPMAVAAFWTENQLTPLILAIGMSIHWPIIGWSFGRTAPFIAHALVRALGVFAIWQFLPEARFTLLPLYVAGVYLVTVLVLLIDSARLRGKLQVAAP